MRPPQVVITVTVQLAVVVVWWWRWCSSGGSGWALTENGYIFLVFPFNLSQFVVEWWSYAFSFPIVVRCCVLSSLLTWLGFANGNTYFTKLQLLVLYFLCCIALFSLSFSLSPDFLQIFYSSFRFPLSLEKRKRKKLYHNLSISIGYITASSHHTVSLHIIRL